MTIVWEQRIIEVFNNGWKMNVAMLAQRSFRAKHSPFGCWSGQRSAGPSGGARTNKVAGCAQDGSGSSSFPKGTKIFFNILTTGAALPVCVG